MENAIIVLVTLAVIAYVASTVATIVLLVKYMKIWPTVEKSFKLMDAILEECGNSIGQSVKDSLETK